MLIVKSPVNIHDYSKEMATKVLRLQTPLFYAPLKNSLDLVCGAGEITFTRSTAATYQDRYGILRWVDVDQPRFDQFGLLIEGESVNRIYPSEDLNNSNWLKYNCSIETSTTITLPDGTSGTNCGIIADTSLNRHHVRICVTSSETTITGSVFLKKGNKSYAMLEIAFREEDYTFIKDCYGRINLETGELFGLNSMSNVSMEMEIKECAYDWYRVIIKATYSGSITVGKISLEIFSCISDGGTIYTGDGNSVEIYAWGAQLEEKPFATSYIPTTTASVTRNADVCYVTYNGNVPNIINGNFSMACDFDCLGDSIYTVSNRHLLTTNLFYTPKYNALYLRKSTNYLRYLRGATSTNYVISYPIDTKRRICVTVSSDNIISVYENGVLKVTDTKSIYSSDISSNIKIGIGCDDAGTGQLYGHISNLRIYDFALTEEEIKLL